MSLSGEALEYETSLTPPLFYWSACTKQRRWTVRRKTIKFVFGAICAKQDKGFVGSDLV